MFRAVDTVSRRDSGELDWGEGWGPAERARVGHIRGRTSAPHYPHGHQPPLPVP